MASLPYVTSPGNIERALNAIKAASVPDRVSQDFVKTILKIPGGSGDQMTAFLKKIGFAASDGAPTELYTKFRNPSSSGAAVAMAMKKAYAPLYVRSEYMHELSDDDLLGLIVEQTGLAHDSNPVKLTFSSIKALKGFANFGGSEDMPLLRGDATLPDSDTVTSQAEAAPRAANAQRERNVGLNLGYVINLNLPATSDPAVFNAIFKSLKEHLLSEDDA